MIRVKIKENSWVAKWAAFKLGVDSCAIVVHSSIHLCGSSRENFMSNPAWVRHELCHVRQWHRDGIAAFLFYYIWWTIRHGYMKNPYEIEARAAEHDPTMLIDIEFQE